MPERARRPPSDIGMRSYKRYLEKSAARSAQSRLPTSFAATVRNHPARSGTGAAPAPARRPPDAVGVRGRRRSEAVASRPTTWASRRTRRVAVVLARCSGSDALAKQLGTPLLWIGLAPKPHVAVARLNERRHGACTPRRDRFVPEDGWDDWRQLRVLPSMAGTARLGAAVVVADGCVMLDLKADISLPDVATAVSASLRHLRLHEFAGVGAIVRHRMEMGFPAVIPPRYTARDYPSCLDCRRVDDIYAFDPWRALPLLGTMVDAALIAEA